MPDEYHPTLEGSKLLGCEVLKRLTGNSNQRINYFNVKTNAANDAIEYSTNKNDACFMNTETPVAPIDLFFKTGDKTNYNSSDKITICIGDGVTDTQLPIMQATQLINFILYRDDTNTTKSVSASTINRYDKEEGKMYVDIIPSYAFTTVANSTLTIKNALTTSYTEFPIFV